jgi:hypothetical protein
MGALPAPLEPPRALPKLPRALADGADQLLAIPPQLGFIVHEHLAGERNRDANVRRRAGITDQPGYPGQAETDRNGWWPSTAIRQPAILPVGLKKLVVQHWMVVLFGRFFADVSCEPFLRYSKNLASDGVIGFGG